MKKILYLLISLLFISCDTRVTDDKTYLEKMSFEEERVSRKMLTNDLAIIRVDSCEYILLRGENLIHKNDCKFCKMRKDESKTFKKK